MPKDPKNYKRDNATLITITQGDITKAKVDAIVNAANYRLLGGGGVDGAIHNAAGPELFEACKKIGGCETGQVKVTNGYDLPAKYIIHAVGPRYGQEDGKEEELLTSCYINSIKAAYELGAKSIAFPAISTGVFGYPFEEAAQVVVKVMLYMQTNEKDIFSSFDHFDFIFSTKEKSDIFQKIFANKFTVI